MSCQPLANARSRPRAPNFSLSLALISLLTSWVRSFTPKHCCKLIQRYIKANGTFSGLALWLTPSPFSPAASSSPKLISDLSTTHDTLSFAPHVTLLTGIATDAPVPPLIDALEKALVDIKPFHITYTEFGTHGTYFQYLFAAVDKSDELAELRSVVRRACLPQLPAEEPAAYFPHLSLMYGSDQEGRKAEDILDELRESGTEVEPFKVESVSVVKCEGPPGDWEVLKVVELER